MVTKKNKILIVTNVQIKGNPALWFICNALETKYEISISGNERESKTTITNNFKYQTHSGLYSLALKLKLFSAIKFFCQVRYFGNLLKREEIANVTLLKLRLFLQRAEFNIKAPKINCILNIDTEAAFISMPFSQKEQIPTIYFIYEFYADQFLERKDRFYHHRVIIEKLSIQNADIILSTVNEKAGDFLKQRYNSEAKVVSVTICPEKTFSDKIKINNPLKFYYHGYFFDNRGLADGILAMKELDGAELYLRGSGFLEKTLKKLVKENKLDKKVFFLDPVPTELLSMVGAEFDIGLTMSRQNVLNQKYAQGFKAFENISAGLALIVPASPPLKQLIDEYKNGKNYSDATIEYLVPVFQYCLKNPEEVLTWKKNSQKAYQLEYNPEKQKSRLISEIEILLNNGKNGTTTATSD